MSGGGPNTMEGMMEAALKSLEEMKLALPAAAFEHSFGIVLMEAVQVGFFVSAGVGTGILLRHDKANNKWSPPIAVGISGVGAGVQVGLQRKHMVIFLTERDLMQSVGQSSFNFRLGLQSSIAAGPVGEEVDITAQIGTKGAGTTLGYTYTRGLYAGVQLEGAALAPRDKVNKAFYGDKIPIKKVLFGELNEEQSSRLLTCEPLQRLNTKLQELAAAPDPDPTYAETIAHPFLKANKNTSMMEQK